MRSVFRSSDEQLKNFRLNFQKQGYHFRWTGSLGSEGRAVTASPESCKAASFSYDSLESRWEAVMRFLHLDFSSFCFPFPYLPTFLKIFSAVSGKWICKSEILFGPPLCHSPMDTKDIIIGPFTWLFI